jgi:hypothetical protein
LEFSVTTVPTVPSNASLPSIALVLEENYGVPWELLKRFADKVAERANQVAEAAVSEFAGDWLDW